MKLVSLLTIVLSTLGVAQANGELAHVINQAGIAALSDSNVAPLNLINWKVGDTMNYDVSISGFALGKSTKSVTADEGTAIWLKQDTQLMGQKDVVELLMNKADGKILKMIHNGKEEQLPNNGDIEIIEQGEATITVKAGTFETIYIHAKTKDIEKIEAWINFRDAALDGTIKQGVQSQMGMVTLELTSFRRN